MITLKRALFIAVSLTIAASARAQGVANSLHELRLLVGPGDAITVTSSDGRETTGRIADLSATSLTLLDGKRRYEWREADVTRIRQRRADSLGNGALWGLASGLGFVAFAAISASETSWSFSGGEAAAMAALWAAIGTGAGVGIDALIVKRSVIYERPARAGLVAAPILEPSRTGALLAIRF